MADLGNCELTACSGCSDQFPKTLEFFPPTGLGGLRRRCWRCYKAQRAARHKANPEKTEKWRRDNPLLARVVAIRSDARRRAEERGLPFDERITTDLIFTSILNYPHCDCCGKKFSFGKSERRFAKNPDTPSLDRLDSSRGYLLENIAIICWRCNDVKGDSTADELEVVAAWMRANG